jgi:hypothetical protein
MGINGKFCRTWLAEPGAEVAGPGQGLADADKPGLGPIAVETGLLGSYVSREARKPEAAADEQFRQAQGQL